MAGEKYLIDIAAGNLPANGASASLTVEVHRDDTGAFADLTPGAYGSRDFLRADEFTTQTVAAPDLTAPIPSAVSGTQTGATTATWSATSNEAGGTMFAAAWPAASADPTAAQVIAGTGGSIVAASSDTTPTADANNGGSFAGLTASAEYQVGVVHRDAAGNDSALVVSAGTFTTASSGSTYTPLYQSDFASFGANTAWATEANIQQLFTENVGNTATIVHASDYVELFISAGFAALGLAYDGTVAADQRSVAVYDSIDGAGAMFITPFVRGSAASNDLSGYAMTIGFDTVLGSATVDLQEFSAGSSTGLASTYTLPATLFQGQRFELEIKVVGGDHILTGRAQLTSGDPAMTDIFPSVNLGASPSYTTGLPGIRFNTAQSNRRIRVSYAEFGEFA